MEKKEIKRSSKIYDSLKNNKAFLVKIRKNYKLLEKEAIDSMTEKKKTGDYNCKFENKALEIYRKKLLEIDKHIHQLEEEMLMTNKK